MHRVTAIHFACTFGRLGCYIDRMGKLSPIESEFATTEEAEAYDRWFRAKVETSLADPRPPVSHHTVMAEMDSIIEAAEHGPRAD